MQYFLLLKIEKAKDLLLRTKKAEKEIAYSLGFESDYSFNHLFKQKVGLTPRQVRNKTEIIEQPKNKCNDVEVGFCNAIPPGICTISPNV